jgi:hypothetical protein
MNYRLSFLIVYLLSSLDPGNIASFGIAIKEAWTLQNPWHVHVRHGYFGDTLACVSSMCREEKNRNKIRKKKPLFLDIF